MLKKWIILTAAKLVKATIISAGVPVIITNSKNEILLGKRNKNAPYYSNLWGLPGGMIDYKENSIDTAKREVKEELGIDIKITKKSKNIYEFLPRKECPIHSTSIVYFAKIIKGKPKPVSETQEIKWVNPKELKKMRLAYNHKEILKTEGIIK